MNGKIKTRNIDKIRHTALYCRLSKDDGRSGESMSIGSQKIILENHAKQLGIRNYKFYVDDGFSGMNSDRPSFQKMLRDIELGNVDCVMTKDLSRLGRNSIETNTYIEIFFPENKVRYIAVNDAVDSKNQTGMDITPFKNIFNEFSSRETSRRVTTAKNARASQGKFMGTTAPFGYKKDPKDKNHLIIDEETAPTVRRMFELALQHYSGQRIIRTLTEERYPKPSYYKPEHFGSMSLDDDETYNWKYTKIITMLRNPVYKGGMWKKSYSKTYFKQKSRGYIKIADRETIEDVHEAIIDKAVWELVQKNIDSHSRFRKAKHNINNIFRGKLRCEDCGCTLLLRTESKGKRTPLERTKYECATYRKLGNSYCTAHRIDYLDIYDIILKDIKKQSKELMDDKKAFLNKISDKYEALSTKNSKQLALKLDKLNIRHNEIDKLFIKSYEDYTKGILSEKRLGLVNDSYEQEQAEIKAEIKKLSEELSNASSEEENVDNFIKFIKKCSNITKLNDAIMSILIDKIIIGKKTVAENGEITQKIKIIYNFVGNID